MAKDYSKAAKAILENVGGADNVSALTHCMTRLRFVLKDEAKVNHEQLKKISEVMGVVKQEGGVQVIIGNSVGACYAEIMKLGVAGAGIVADDNAVKHKLTLKRVGANILDAIIGTMSPLIPAIIGGSMLKLVAMVLQLTGIVESTDSTYKILMVIGDGPFFFLPIMVACSAARKFNVNIFLAMAIAGAMVHPDFINMMAAAADQIDAAGNITKGIPVDLAAIPIISVKYTYTVIPAIVMTWILGYIERGVDSITPPITKNFLKPMLILLIGAPIAIIAVGPLGVLIGNGISSFVFWVHDILGWLSVAIMGAIWPLLVMTGMHRVFTPTIVQTIAQTGQEGTVMPSEIGANLSLGGVSLAVALKTKNIELRQTAIAAAASAIVAGITEPALYGVAVRLKRPMIASSITGFVCGAIAGMGGLASHSMASPGLFTSVQFIDPVNPGRSIAFIVAVMVVAVVLSFILTLILGFKDIPNEGNEAAL